MTNAWPEPRTPLRIGVLLDSLEVPAWRHRILRDISEAGFCEIVLAVLNDQSTRNEPVREETSGRRWPIWQGRGLFELYRRWDRRTHEGKNSAFAKVDVSPLLPADIRLEVAPVRTRYSDRFPDWAVAAVRDADLDVLIRFGFRILKGDILNAARFGVWSYHHGDNREYRGGPALFWELYERNPVSGSILQVLTENLDDGHVIYRSWSATDFSSLYRNRNPIYWKSAAFVLRRLRDLHERGWKYVLDSESQESTYTKGIYRAPTNVQMVPFLWRAAAERVRGRIRRSRFATRNHWRLVVRPAGSWRDGSGGGGSERHLVPPRDRFYADPFIWKMDDRHYLFFEDYRFALGRGLVSFVEIDSEGNFSEPEVVLERGHHLSYPFVFAWQGQMYMIPETKQKRRVELYRAVEFPRRWQMEHVILDGVQAVDATVHAHGDRLWLFCNIAVDGASTWDELHLFSARAPRGPWRPHPRNPVISDFRRARPAGRPFDYQGRLMRPSQDCLRGYGRAIHVNEIHCLDEDEYREQPCYRITPDQVPGSRGIHTIDQTVDLEVIDARFPLRAWHRHA